jgi:hypothetical protein
MKKKLISCAGLILFAMGLHAQVKDTVKPDSTHLEKIRKMPMDTVPHNTPVKPVLPEEQKDKSQPITTPSGKEQ